MALLLTGCGTSVAPASPGAGAAAAVTLENCGRKAVVSDAPKAAVGMHPAQTELLLRLGLAGRIAGQAQAKAQALPEDVAPLAANIPVIGGVTPPSREDLLAVKPDFVYSPTTYEFTAEQGFASIEQLEQAGVSVYVANGGCKDRRMTGEVTDLFTDLENIGKIFGVDDAAAGLIAKSRAELDKVAKALAGVKRLRVAQVYVDGTTLQAIGAGVEYDILRLAGGGQRLHSRAAGVREVLRRDDHARVPRGRAARRAGVLGVRRQARGRDPQVPHHNLPGHAGGAR
ncbi:ABC transporter substrate-binding protein [Nonomuraea salmonea]|uniref:ABC transporter substrate-binding protein n=1 Tax=Nonomuraea salmonea TaxID=46181 RepID=UPI0031EFFBBB